jgi:hypothetical protein
MTSLFKGISDCCWLLLIVALVVMAATKPDEQAHRKAISQRTPVLGALYSVAEYVGSTELEYHDYWVLSVITARAGRTGPTIPISIGVLGKVYYGKNE